jgi:hypothetical protein
VTRAAGVAAVCPCLPPFADTEGIAALICTCCSSGSDSGLLVRLRVHACAFRSRITAHSHKCSFTAEPMLTLSVCQLKPPCYANARLVLTRSRSECHAASRLQHAAEYDRRVSKYVIVQPLAEHCLQPCCRRYGPPAAGPQPSHGRRVNHKRACIGRMLHLAAHSSAVSSCGPAQMRCTSPLPPWLRCTQSA